MHPAGLPARKIGMIKPEPKLPMVIVLYPHTCNIGQQATGVKTIYG
jgi:hypothetical protein